MVYRREWVNLLDVDIDMSMGYSNVFNMLRDCILIGIFKYCERLLINWNIRGSLYRRKKYLFLYLNDCV